jgi:galactose mutarotase-like enzyme
LFRLSSLLLLSLAAFGADRYSVGESRALDVRLLLLQDSIAGLEAAVAPAKGGELASLVFRRNGMPLELIYLGRDYSPRSGFAGKAMFLWPATGPVTGTRWKSGDREYPMPFHGFAKDAAWEVVEHGATATSARAVLRLQDSPSTREHYPFGFTLTVTYTLAGGKLTLSYSVKAAQANSGAMPFAIGNHVAFNLPPSGQGSAAKVVLETNCRDEILRDQASLPTGVVRPWRYAPSTPLGDLRAIPAVSLANCGREARLSLRDAAGLTLDLRHRASRLPKMPVVQFNLYGAAAEGYFSPEPWIGLQGGLNSGKGLTALKPGESWNWTIELGVRPGDPQTGDRQTSPKP